MLKLLLTIGFAVGLTGCVVAPPYGYPAYGYAPGYYAANVADFDGNRLEFVHKPWNRARC